MSSGDAVKGCFGMAINHLKNETCGGCALLAKCRAEAHTTLINMQRQLAGTDQAGLIDETLQYFADLA